MKTEEVAKMMDGVYSKCCLAERIAQKRNREYAEKKRTSASASVEVARVERAELRSRARYTTGGFSHLGGTGAVTGNNIR